MNDDSGGKAGMDDPVDRENFLSRWSQRKSASRSAESPADAETETLTTAVEPTTAGQSELNDADMPPIDSLGEDSDYAAFMSPKVSEALRKQALQRLFHLPACNITDGLDDYDEDFTRFAGLGNVITHEMKRMLQREAELDGANEAQGQREAELDGANEAQGQREAAGTATTDVASAAELSEPDQAGAEAPAEGSEGPDRLQGPADA